MNSNVMVNLILTLCVAAELTPVPKVPVTTSVDSTGSGGKRKRKIQLVPSHRDDNISLVRRHTDSILLNIFNAIYFSNLPCAFLFFSFFAASTSRTGLHHHCAGP